jgi:malate permease and related proteins
MLFIDIIIPVFLMVSAGFGLEKAGKLDFRTLTFSSLYLFTPALVFASLIKHDLNPTLARDILVFMLLYTGTFLLIAKGAGKLFRMDRDTQSALALTTVVMNIGNFGLPLTYFAFGEAGLETSIMTFVMFNIPLGTLAIVLAQGSQISLSEALGNMAKIPIFHAVLLAFLWKVLHLHMPLFLLRPIELLGQAAIPVMLVMLGMQLANTRIGSWPVFLTLSSVLRLGVAPLLAWLLTVILGIEAISQKVLILQTSTPAAVLPLLYSLRFGTRPDLVAGAILTSTLLSSISLTVLLYFLQ